MINDTPSIFCKYWDAWLFLGVCVLAVVMGAWAFNGVRLPTNMAVQPEKSVALLSDSLPNIPVKYQGRVIGQVDDYQFNDGQVAMTFNLNQRMDMQRADAQLITDPAPAVQLALQDNLMDDDANTSRLRQRFTVNFAYADVLPLIATAAGDQTNNSDQQTDITQDFMDDAESHLRRVFGDIYSHYHGIYSYFFPSDEPENTKNN